MNRSTRCKQRWTLCDKLATVVGRTTLWETTLAVVDVLWRTRKMATFRVENKVQQEVLLLLKISEFRYNTLSLSNCHCGRKPLRQKNNPVASAISRTPANSNGQTMVMGQTQDQHSVARIKITSIITSTSTNVKWYRAKFGSSYKSCMICQALTLLVISVTFEGYWKPLRGQYLKNTEGRDTLSSGDVYRKRYVAYWAARLSMTLRDLQRHFRLIRFRVLVILIQNLDFTVLKTFSLHQSCQPSLKVDSCWWH